MKSISKQVKIGDNVKIGDFVVIEDNVEIGINCVISHGVVIKDGSIIGNGVRIDENSVVGKLPMRAATSSMKDETKLPPCRIGDNVIIGASAIIYRGCDIKKDTLIADLATVRENVKIGEKTIVGRNVSIENYCTVGNYCKLETNAYITAFSNLEDHVFIAPGVVTSNDNYAGRSKERFDKFKGITVKKGGRIGAQATILPGMIIEEEAFVAAGAVVTKNVEQEIIVMGNPAKCFKKVDEEQLLKNQN